jgi:hypothetical protein
MYGLFTEEAWRLLPRDKAAFGRVGEEICKNVLTEAGVRYYSLCDICNGGAPLLEGKGAEIAPDFRVGINCGHYKTFAYLDAKAKTGPVLWRKTNQYRHGINERNYQAYKSVAAFEQVACGIFVVELFTDENTVNKWSGTILIGSFARLGPPEYGINEPQPKVYWARKRLRVLGELSPKELGEIAHGSVVPNFGVHMQEEFDRKEQAALFA